MPRAGAIGYLLKNTEADEMIRAIKAAAACQVQLSPEAAARLMREVRSPDNPETLTEREIDVLRLLASGRSNKEIAHDLNIGFEEFRPLTNGPESPMKRVPLRGFISFFPL